MALSPLGSVQYLAEQSQNRKDGIYDTGVRCAYGKWVADAAGQGSLVVFTLPPGRIFIHNYLSRMKSNTTFVSGANLHIGHGAYVNQAGTAVDADDNEWFDNLAPQAGALETIFQDGAITDMVSEYNSKSGIPVEIMVDTQNASIGAQVEVTLYYSKEGSA